MSVNKYKAIEYYLKKHNKVENGVYTENILCGNLDMITPSMITSANKKAKELGAKYIFLDDGFRFHFKKLNIVLQPKLQPYFPFLLHVDQVFL